MSTPTPLGCEYRSIRVALSWVDTSQSGLSVAVFPSRVRKGSSLQAVMDYENPDVVHKIQVELGVSAEMAETIFSEVKRFLWLAAVTEHSVVPSPIIDEGWHRFVLYTEDYAKFSDRYFGGFLDHAPQRLGEPRLTADQLKPTIDAMHEEFGDKPSTLWDYVPVDDFVTGHLAA